MHDQPPRRLRFRLNTIFLLSLGIAVGYAWNLWIWRVEHYLGSEAKMVRAPAYVIEPPDVVRIDVDHNPADPLMGSDKEHSAPIISGQYRVAMDGRINLGLYGNVSMAGLTIEQAKDAIMRQVAKRFYQSYEPKVIVEVAEYNSKAYYIIVEDRSRGDNVTRALVTGDETVLDAIAISDLQVTAATEIRIARPAPSGVGPQIDIPVDYHEITRDAVTAHNYQLLPGDRVFISQKRRADQSTAAAQGSPKR